MSNEAKVLEILETPYEVLVNDAKAQWEFDDMQKELWLEQVIPEYEKWSRKYLHTPEVRKPYLEIIRNLKKELKDVRQTNTKNRRTVGQDDRGYLLTDRKARDGDNHSPQAVQSPVRDKEKRVHSLSGSPIQWKECDGSPVRI